MSNTLLIAFVLCGAQNMPTTSEQQAVIKEIEALGGLVIYKGEGANRTIEEIGFKGAKFDDSHLRLLRPFQFVPDLRIWFNGARISDEAVGELADFNELRGLSLFGAPISDRGILSTRLSQKTNLITLTLSGTQPLQVSDAIMPHVAVLTKLQQLDLSNTCITSQGLRHLAYLENLEMLDLSGTSIDDDGLVYLSKLTKLWWMDLGNNKITDKGLTHLRSLANLDTLLLNDTQITDAGLIHLASMNKLRALRLDGTKITGRNLRVLMSCPALAQLDVDRTPVGLAELRALQDHPSLDRVDLFLSEEAETNPEWEEFWRNLPFVRSRAAEIEERRKRTEEGKKKRGELTYDVVVEVVKVGKDGKETVVYSTEEEPENDEDDGDN